MMTQTLMVRDMAGELCPLEITVVDDESELWAIEEPPEPVISVTFDGHSWVVYGDDNADHPDFHVRWWPGEHWEVRAKAYARQWARAVRGSWEVL